MALSTGGGGRSTLTEINITPLVDVMLVLLIIFMVTAPLIQQGVDLQLPEVLAKPLDESELKLVLSVRADRTVWLGAGKDAVQVPLPRLEELLRANARARREGLDFMADRSVSYGDAVEALAAAQRAGIARIGIVTNPPMATPPGREERR